jgi:hypothetical protein
MITNACTQQTEPKTIPSKFKRLKYYRGMLLTEEDLREEQTYYREKLRLHNRLHGNGVVWGLLLKAVSSPSGDCKGPMVAIEPGLAFDCEGNEIVVCKEYSVCLKDKIDWLKEHGKISANGSCFSLPEPVKIWVGVQYCECNSRPQPQFTSTCGEDKLNPEFSRTLEGFCVVLLAAEELPCKPPKKRKDEDCGAWADECSLLARCCEGGHIVILGSVAIADANTPKITAADIDMNDRRKYVVLTVCSGSPLKRWEQAKSYILETLRDNGSLGNDISAVIGKPIEVAKAILNNLGITDIKQVTPLTIGESMLARIQAAVPLASVGSKITLIVDEEKQCVLFPLVM